MSNADMPVSPVRGATNVPFKDNDIIHMSSHMIGITKREYFAGIALQGWLARCANAPHGVRLDPTQIAISAMEMADALLKEIER